MLPVGVEKQAVGSKGGQQTRLPTAALGKGWGDDDAPSQLRDTHVWAFHVAKLWSKAATELGIKQQECPGTLRDLPTGFIAAGDGRALGGGS